MSRGMSRGFAKIDIVGDRVRLRPVRAADAKAAYSFLTDEAILSWLLWDGPSDESEVFDTYSQWETELKAGKSFHLAMERPGHPGIIGCIGIRLPAHPQQADIGFWLGVPFWGKGYMSDAIRLACHFCFQYLNVVGVHAEVFTGNDRSRRALEKNGFSLDGTLRWHFLKRGQWRDTWFLSLLRSEWQPKRDWFRPRYEEVVPAETREDG